MGRGAYMVRQRISAMPTIQKPKAPAAAAGSRRIAELQRIECFLPVRSTEDRNRAFGGF